MKNLVMILTLVIALFAVTTPASFAADHLDGPAVINEPASDVNDLYAWMENGTTINLVMTVFPQATSASKFSDAVRYVFDVFSSSAYGEGQRKTRITCQFDSDQMITCDRDGLALVIGVDASDEAGVSNEEGTFRVFAGLRNDPFFFDANNFNVARQGAIDYASSVDSDAAGCPDLGATKQSVVLNTLTGQSDGFAAGNAPAVDSFAGGNVLAIVTQVDISLLEKGPIYGVEASTRR